MKPSLLCWNLFKDFHPIVRIASFSRNEKKNCVNILLKTFLTVVACGDFVIGINFDTDIGIGSFLTQYSFLSQSELVSTQAAKLGISF